MASVYSGNYSTGTYTYTRVRVDYSGTSATAHLLYSRTNSWSGETSAYGVTFTFGGVSTTFDVARYGEMYDSEVASVSFTISASGGTYSGSTSNGSLFSFDGSVTIPSQAPTGLSLSGVQAGPDWVSGTLSVSAWNGGDSSTRYRNLSVMATNDKTTSVRRYERVYGNDLSGLVYVDNNTAYGTMTIVPNTQYWLWWYATNGIAAIQSPDTSTTTVTTLPPKVTDQYISNLSATSFTINWTIPADGGKYAKDYAYSIDGGTTWVSCYVKTDGTMSTAYYVITGLDPTTQYTVKFRVTTSAGTTYCDDFETVTTLARLYGSVNGVTKRIIKLYGPVNGTTKRITKLYGSVNGVTKRVF